jgi:enterochelin esterase-like enzyme
MRNLNVIILSLLMPSLLLGQTGKVMDDLSFTSKILKMERKYAIYLPPDYETSRRSYPVLYLLHGGGDDQTAWVQFGQVLHIADEAINQGTVTPMIIVMPDANTGQRGYFNDIKGEWRYEDFFFQELIPYIEKQYRTRNDKQYRAVAGVSMGGGGAFIYALHHPEMFSSSCPLSASIGALSKDEARKNLEKRGIRDFTDEQLNAYYKRYSVLPLLDSMPDDQKKAVRWYIDCGDDDFLYEGNCLVHIAMRKLEIPHEFRIRDGIHGWVYWRPVLPEVLSFVSDAFHQD